MARIDRQNQAELTRQRHQQSERERLEREQQERDQIKDRQLKLKRTLGLVASALAVVAAVGITPAARSFWRSAGGPDSATSEAPATTQGLAANASQAPATPTTDAPIPSSTSVDEPTPPIEQEALAATANRLSADFAGLTFAYDQAADPSARYEDPAAAQATIAKAADDLTRLDAAPGSTLYVIGHTDSIGSEESNLATSRKRARTVANDLRFHLVNRSELEILAYGCGESEPLPNLESEDPGQRRVSWSVEAPNSPDCQVADIQAIQP